MNRKINKPDLTTAELKMHLKHAGVKVQPSYMHKDYMYTSFTAPYPVMAKLDKMLKYIKCSRSNFIQTLILQAYDKFEGTNNPFGK